MRLRPVFGRGRVGPASAPASTVSPISPRNRCIATRRRTAHISTLCRSSLEGLEGVVLSRPARMAGRAHHARTVVEVRAGQPTEVSKGTFVRLQELTQLFVGEPPVEPSAAIPQRQHEDVDLHRTVAEADPGLTPVDLTLFAWRRLEAPLRQRVIAELPAQRCHEAFHRLIAAGLAVLGTPHSWYRI